MRKEFKVTLVVLSALALLNVLFVPIFDVWGGLFPSDVECNFAGVIEEIFEDSDAWRHWVVILTTSIFVPTLIMFFMSFTGKKWLFLSANVVGIILWFKQIIDYGMEDDGFEDLLDFEDGCVSIGTWIAIILYIICFFVAVASKKKKENKQLVQPSTIITENTPIIDNAEFKSQSNEVVVPVDNRSAKYCPECGSEVKATAIYCGKCGYKL